MSTFRPTQPVRLFRPVYSDTTQLNWTQLNSTRQREQQLTQFVGRGIIKKNTTDLALRCSTGSVAFTWVQLSWVELCRYKHPLYLQRDEKWVIVYLAWATEYGLKAMCGWLGNIVSAGCIVGPSVRLCVNSWPHNAVCLSAVWRINVCVFIMRGGTISSSQWLPLPRL